MSRTLLRFAPAAALAALAAPLAQAADLDTINLLTQREFRQLSEDVAAATSFKPLTGAAPGGVTGFDIGVTLTATELAHRGVWRKAAGGASVPDVVPVLGLRAHKGLPLNLDVGVFYNTLPDSNVRATGGEIRWAFVPGSTVLPAVALRVSGSKLSGVQQLEMRTLGADLSISKGFLFLTPYAGVGAVETKSRAPGTTLRDESFRQDRVFAGVNLALVPLAINVEADRTGEATSYNIKFAIRW
jgi:hypothetical protein